MINIISVSLRLRGMALHNRVLENLIRRGTLSRIDFKTLSNDIGEIVGVESWDSLENPSLDLRVELFEIVCPEGRAQ